MSLTGLTKILLFMNFVFPVLIAAVGVIFYWVNPDAVTFSFDGKMKLLGVMTLNMEASSLITLLVFGIGFLINSVFVSLLAASVIKLIALYTPLGKMKVSLG